MVATTTNDPPLQKKSEFKFTYMFYPRKYRDKKYYLHWLDGIFIFTGCILKVVGGGAGKVFYPPPRALCTAPTAPARSRVGWSCVWCSCGRSCRGPLPVGGGRRVWWSRRLPGAMANRGVCRDPLQCEDQSLVPELPPVIVIGFGSNADSCHGEEGWLFSGANIAIRMKKPKIRPARKL